MESRTSDRRRYVQRVLIAVGILTAVALAVWVFASAVQGVFVIFAGILLSVFFVELAQRVARWTGLSYPWAVGITLAVLLVVGGGTLFLIGTRIAERADELVVQSQQALDDLASRLRDQEWGRRLLQRISSADESLSTTQAVTAARTTLTTVGAFVAAVLIIAFLGLYFSVKPQYYHDALLILVPPAKRARAGEVIDTIGEKLWWWILGRLFGMVIIGTGSAVGLWFIGIPLPVTLGVIAGLLTFVPNIGPTLSVIPPLLFGLQQSPMTGAYVLILYVGLQFVESYFLTPMIEQHQVFLPPGITLSSQLMLGLLTGLLGVFLATPLAVVVHTLVKELYVKDVLESSGRVVQESSVRPARLPR